MKTSADSRIPADFLFVVLRRRWRLILGCTILLAAAAFAFSALQTKAYTASASLLFRNTQFDQELFGTNFTPTINDPTQEEATNIDLVSLPTVATRTALALHLPPGTVESGTRIAGVGQSNVARVSITDPDPARAARIANEYAHQYVLFRQEADRSKIAAAQSLVRRQILQLRPAERSGSVGQSLHNRADQLGVLAALQTGNAEVVQPATVPTSPSSPKTKRNVVLGVLLGLLLALVTAFGIERFDRRIREPSELEDAYGVPILGAVPDSDAYTTAGRLPLPAAESEAFALIRARLRYFNVDRDVRSLLITSANPGEGKTTVALNLAIAEAKAANTRVVLVEADLRRPTLATRLGIHTQAGLSELLSRNADLDDVLCDVRVPTQSIADDSMPVVSVVTAGVVPPNPAELVESHAMIDLLTSLSQRFDLVILDTPPTSVVSDAIPIMRLASGVVVVSRIGSVTRDSARHLREQLHKLHAPTLGVVANALAAKSRGYYGYSDRHYGSPPDGRRSYPEQSDVAPER